MGPSRAILCASWANLVPVGGMLGPYGLLLGSLLGHFAAMLGPSSGLIGVMMKSYVDDLGSSLRYVDPGILILAPDDDVLTHLT